MNILVWHVHGAWTTAFVQGRHRYLLPVLPERGPWGAGRPATWNWPGNAVEIDPRVLSLTDVDVVVLQRPQELELAERWLGRRLGRDVAAVYVEHNTPREHAATSRHPMADRDDLTVVHVTRFNALMWDTGTTRTTVIEHGIVDPGPRYTGEIPAAAVVVNEPRRRNRVTGTDLLGRFSRALPLDVYGMETEQLSIPGVRPHGDLPQHRLHTEMARRRVYLHPMRWTSLGLSLIEAMHLAMPVVALATTEAHEAVPPGTGYCSTDVELLLRRMRELAEDPVRARDIGAAARAYARARYGLERFLADWEIVLTDAVDDRALRGRRVVVTTHERG